LNDNPDRVNALPAYQYARKIALTGLASSVVNFNGNAINS